MEAPDIINLALIGSNGPHRGGWKEALIGIGIALFIIAILGALFYLLDS